MLIATLLRVCGACVERSILGLISWQRMPASLTKKEGAAVQRAQVIVALVVDYSGGSEM